MYRSDAIRLEIKHLHDLALDYKNNPNDEAKAFALLEIDPTLTGDALREASSNAFFAKGEPHIRTLQAALSDLTYTDELPNQQILYSNLEFVLTQLFRARGKLHQSATIGSRGENRIADPLQSSQIMKLMGIESMDQLPLYCRLLTGLYPYPDIDFRDMLETRIFYRRAKETIRPLTNQFEMNPKDTLGELLLPLVQNFYGDHPYFLIYLNNKLVPPQTRLEEVPMILNDGKVPFFSLLEAASQEHMDDENTLSEPLLEQSRLLYSLNTAAQRYEGLFQKLPSIPGVLSWQESQVREVYTTSRNARAPEIANIRNLQTTAAQPPPLKANKQDVAACSSSFFRNKQVLPLEKDKRFTINAEEDVIKYKGSLALTDEEVKSYG